MIHVPIDGGWLLRWPLARERVHHGLKELGFTVTNHVEDKAVQMTAKKPRD